MDNFTANLSLLGIDDTGQVSHAKATNAAEWKDALSGITAPIPKPHDLSKCLLFKPKVAKSQEQVYILVVALEESDTPSKAISELFKFKEARLAQEDVFQDILGANKDSVSPFLINEKNKGKVLIALDKKIESSPNLIAFRAAVDKSFFVPGPEVKSFLVKSGVQISEFNSSEFAKAGEAQRKQQAASNVTTTAAKSKKNDAKREGAALIGIDVRKEGDFSEWYQQVLTKGDMLDYYDVSGCYILKPWSYTVWQNIQTWFDAKIKELGVENGYFPMFVSSTVLEKEKDHIEGFAPEVAWVTRAGSSELEIPIAIRPTSETVMYPYYAKWIRSHRDLPLKINQWNSVVRWEFKHPQPFLRTREFLWQEGHTAHLTKEEADKEVLEILDLYSRVYTDLLAVPVTKGVKSEKEKFAGGLYTTTVEGFIPATGRAIQGGTSHCLGQNFSKMFDICVEDPSKKSGDAEKIYVWQNSWGLSTRTIGVMVMVHGDDNGLIMPPRVSQIQVIVIPCGLSASATAEEKSKVLNEVDMVLAILKEKGVRAKGDLRDTYTVGWKFNDWELKGVPVRLEIGPQDVAKNQVTWVRRDNRAKGTITVSSLGKEIPQLLDTIHNDMYARAKKEYDSRIKLVKEWKVFTSTLNAKNMCLIPWCEESECEEIIKERSSKVEHDPDAAVDDRAPSMGAKSLCIPFEQPSGTDAIVPGQTKCIQCGKEAKRYALFGRSY